MFFDNNVLLIFFDKYIFYMSQANY